MAFGAPARAPALERAAAELRSDRESMLETVKHDGVAVEHAAKMLRMDRDIVLGAEHQQAAALDARCAVRSRDRAGGRAA